MVLEAKFSNQGVDNPGKRQLLCVVGNAFVLSCFNDLVYFLFFGLCFLFNCPDANVQMYMHLFNHVHLMWQANTHVNVHQDLKDVKLWQVIIFFRSSLCAIIIVAYFQDVIIFVFSHTIYFLFFLCIRFILS